ncbi:uncharacterized protein J8A68_002201 [[Candida] subhashii]|uniref:Protein FMP42 n=1 Tax=[Candida] subhashii TaxID=561895 RepID=A0A8J5QPJ5_9ASCO|nr:uncharacterized protein J8A68_002201 [[Candida] subhashii]KAG7664286.1 hypothetical protein J8A68_002201 [[Candida] subhashii]
MHSFEVPSSKRLLQCGCAIFWCLLAGGPIFGFAALKPVLINEQIYEDVCYSNSSTDIMIISNNYNKVVAKCMEQDLKLNFMFTVAAMLTNVTALLIGRILDIYGPKVCGLIGSALLYLACFSFIFSKKVTFIDPYLIGYGLLALGGPFVYISSFQLSNSFPKKSGTILALISGAFDASSAIFLIYRIIYTNSKGTFTLEKFFGVYLIVPTFITILEIFIMPTESYHTSPNNTLCINDQENVGHAISPPSSGSEITSLLEPSSNPMPHHDSLGDSLMQPYAEEGEEILVVNSGGIFGILHGYSWQYQLRTYWFILICLFSIIQMLRLNYFVATIGTQYHYLFGSVQSAEKINKFFDIALPLGGLLSIPFIGIFLDHYSTVVVLTWLVAMSLIIGILGLFSDYTLAVFGICLFVAFRPFFYTTISDYCAKVFGFETFGTVYGTIICISGIFNYSQTWFDEITHVTFDMNPFPVNILFIVMTGVIGVIMVLYVTSQAKEYNARKIQLDQQSL